ncbi:heme NO-binding domain-containing protein [Tranquillimonas rosea]|uniref:heme NO-binding domain-containing protein n=1 Tax=Tranquillimonas rosea TaxID=641238 RepID=UPI003BACD045
MHGLINASLQRFLCDTYGRAKWDEIVRAAGLGISDFEALLSYDDALTTAVLRAAAFALDKVEDMLLEDMGTYLVSHPERIALRRLLRFGGESFPDFLGSLDDLPDRARLALPDLELPRLTLHRERSTRYRLEITGGFPEFGPIALGVLRAMADDYGALAYLDYARQDAGRAVIRIDVHEVCFAEGRRFELAARLA